MKQNYRCMGRNLDILRRTVPKTFWSILLMKKWEL
jgi:hypothetical protein